MRAGAAAAGGVALRRRIDAAPQCRIGVAQLQRRASAGWRRRVGASAQHRVLCSVARVALMQRRVGASLHTASCWRSILAVPRQCSIGGVALRQRVDAVRQCRIGAVVLLHFGIPLAQCCGAA